MTPFLETPRLSLREFRAEDADNLYRLHRDPRVMRYIGDGSVGTRASVAMTLARAANQYRNYPGQCRARATPVPGRSGADANAPASAVPGNRHAIRAPRGSRS